MQVTSIKNKWYDYINYFSFILIIIKKKTLLTFASEGIGIDFHAYLHFFKNSFMHKTMKNINKYNYLFLLL